MSVTITYDDSVLSNSIKIVHTEPGVYYKYINADELYFDAGIPYEISYRLYMESPTKEPFDIYITSSVDPPFNSSDMLGHLVNLVTGSSNTFEEKSHIISPNYDGTGSLCLALKHGTYYIADINVKPYSYGNDSLPELKFTIPTPIIKRNERISLKNRFIGGDNLPVGEMNYLLSNAGQTDGFTKYSAITGSNLIISHHDNLIEGILYVGKTLEGGIEISGDNDAMIRSFGYRGFISASQSQAGAGFMMYSGSVLSGSGDYYRGLGLEIHAGGESGSLRYRVDDDGSFLEVSGNIYAENGYFSGIISASEGYIGGWQILEDKLRSVPENMMLSGSGVISASNFYVSEEGYMSASNGYFSGSIFANDGEIGKWSITENEISSYGNNIQISLKSPRTGSSASYIYGGLEILTDTEYHGFIAQTGSDNYPVLFVNAPTSDYYQEITETQFEQGHESTGLPTFFVNKNGYVYIETGSLGYWRVTPTNLYYETRSEDARFDLVARSDTYGTVGDTYIYMGAELSSSQTGYSGFVQWTNKIIDDQAMLFIGAPDMTSSFDANFSVGYTGNVISQDMHVSGALYVSKSIYCDGDITSFSDKRLKTNIYPIFNALDIINNLNGVKYKKIGSDEEKIGLIAQEVEPFLPEVVHQNEINDYKSIDYSSITALLIEGVKEQNLKLEYQNKLIIELQNSIKELKNEINIIKNKKNTV